jgi:hypothetical protein
VLLVQEVDTLCKEGVRQKDTPAIRSLTMDLDEFADASFRERFGPAKTETESAG